MQPNKDVNLPKIKSDFAELMTILKIIVSSSQNTGASLAGDNLWAFDIPPDQASTERIAQAYSIAFQLLNMVEANAAVQARRDIAQSARPSEVSGLWPQTLRVLAEQGLTPELIAERMPAITIEPVLTAHPTEAKRATVLEHHRYLTTLLDRREREILSPCEQKDLLSAISTEIERLWRTGEIFLEKPDVASERRTIMYYLTDIFPDAVLEADRQLRAAWENMGWDASLLASPEDLPSIYFGSWVGGDRDGHPLVTAAITAETLQQMRGEALTMTERRLKLLAQRQSLSVRLQAVPSSMTARIHQMASILGECGQQALRRNPDEPWRQFVSLMLANLRHYRGSGELLTDLRLLRGCLVDVGAKQIARADVDPVIRSVQIFGFHLGRLDIRQNSRVHDLAVDQLLAAAGHEKSDFSCWSESERLCFLESELLSLRPFTRQGIALEPEAESVVSSLRVIADHIHAYGAEGVGSLILSMTRSLSDLLAIYLLAREAGLIVKRAGGLVCLVPVVPLFETIDDLQRAPDIVRGFLNHPISRLSRSEALGNQLQIMLGYSDSNKDGGIIASHWGLHRAQQQICDVVAEANATVKFFHGRGGTISRGGGPTHRFLKALPKKSAIRGLRLTEQGETIAQKYGNPHSAAFHLALLMSGTTRASLDRRIYDADPQGTDLIMARMAESSQKAYQALIASDGFLEFFRGATPIDAIEASRIGSRPARRTGQPSLADLRAIPWVFSWSQARFYLSGWFGVGTALSCIKEQWPEDFRRLKEHFFVWETVHYLFSNVATSVATADPAIMIQYAQLVTDQALGQRFMDKVMNEYRLTVSMLEELYEGTLAERRSDLHELLAIRQGGLNVLHRLQIDLLKKWRAADQAQRQVLLPELLMSINAIASGLRTTG